MVCCSIFQLLWLASLTFIEQVDEIQGVFQYDPHSFKNVAPQNTLRLRTHFQTCNKTTKRLVCTCSTISHHLNRHCGECLKCYFFPPLSPQVIWPDLSDSPTGCLATEREVEYFRRGCSFSRTRQLAGAMAFCNTNARS